MPPVPEKASIYLGKQAWTLQAQDTEKLWSGLATENLLPPLCMNGFIANDSTTLRSGLGRLNVSFAEVIELSRLSGRLFDWFFNIYPCNLGIVWLYACPHVESCALECSSAP